jgi:hypothetical protein
MFVFAIVRVVPRNSPLRASFAQDLKVANYGSNYLFVTTELVSTGVIAYKLWRVQGISTLCHACLTRSYRRKHRAALHRLLTHKKTAITSSQKILILLVETGLFMCILLVCASVKFQHKLL